MSFHYNWYTIKLFVVHKLCWVWFVFLKKKKKKVKKMEDGRGAALKNAALLESTTKLSWAHGGGDQGEF